MSLEIRTIRRDERDAVLDLLKEWLNDRAFFARYFEHDPEFRDDRCFVAVDGGRIVSTFQIFRKQICINGVAVEVGGVGNVFTTEAYREQRLASRLLEMGIETMQQQGFDLSLLFAVRLKFYASLGWQSHLRHLIYLAPSTAELRGDYEIAPFTKSELGAVRQVYEAYNTGRNGPVIRDLAYWHGQLKYAGNPDEYFLVARQAGQVVAYARGTALYDFFVVTEHGYLRGHRGALTQLINALHSGPGADKPGTLTQLAMEPEICRQLEELGATPRIVEDAFWMWRVISPQGLAKKLGLRSEDLADDGLFRRLLPPESSVYWLSDRF